MLCIEVPPQLPYSLSIMQFAGQNLKAAPHFRLSNQLEGVSTVAHVHTSNLL